MADARMMPWTDRVASWISPRWGLTRLRARTASTILARHYEAAAAGRRTQGWARHSGDANAAIGAAAATLRVQARDLVRNNAYAAAALEMIVEQTVGWGITAKPARTHARALERWKAWAETTACDADGRLDLYGLQKLVARTVVESGEVLVRRRWRRREDGLPIPLQLQVLEPDFLDTTKEQARPRVVNGIEFDAIGRRTAYWLFGEHPGAGAFASFGASQRVPAEDIAHVYDVKRPGQAVGASWFAPVLLRLRDFDEYEDAALMKQKIAACLAVITTDLDGSAVPLGTVDASTPEIEELAPGMIAHVAPGRQVSVVQPPNVSEHAVYTQTVLRAIATGLGISYESLSGDYSQVNFSSARMARLRTWARVEGWRWQMLIPQFCDPVWRWAMRAAAIVDDVPEDLGAVWTAPPMPLIEPVAEAQAYRDLIRIGGMTWSQMVRERGEDPDEQLAELAADNRKFDALGLVLDSDPRKTSQQGQQQSPTPKPAAAGTNGNGRYHEVRA